ncbi:iron-containing redox enzyme family protein [Myxococcota bacterium]|nr:iron-containing redox enzyme family protein [Myxococcota bacterium]
MNTHRRSERFSPTEFAKRSEAQSTGRSAPEDPRHFVDSLQREALGHRAVQHPYLRFLAKGCLPDHRWALTDFARQYRGYANHFPLYLAAVLSRLEDPNHQNCLLENLHEESGRYSEGDIATLEAMGIQRKWFDGIAHPDLFTRFAQALGVANEGADPGEATRRWRDDFYQLLVGSSPAQALGALGLGTEKIVRATYTSLLSAIEHLPELSPRATVFFALHTIVDEHHQSSLRKISIELAKAPGGPNELRRGMLQALDLRAQFWDWLLTRALDPAAAQDVMSNGRSAEHPSHLR